MLIISVLQYPTVTKAKQIPPTSQNKTESEVSKVNIRHPSPYFESQQKTDQDKDG